MPPDIIVGQTLQLKSTLLETNKNDILNLSLMSNQGPELWHYMSLYYNSNIYNSILRDFEKQEGRVWGLTKARVEWGCCPVGLIFSRSHCHSPGSRTSCPFPSPRRSTGLETQKARTSLQTSEPTLSLNSSPLPPVGCAPHRLGFRLRPLRCGRCRSSQRCSEETQ